MDQTAYALGVRRAAAEIWISRLGVGLVALAASAASLAGEPAPIEYEVALDVAECSEDDPSVGVTLSLEAGRWAIAPILTLGNGVSAWNSSGELVDACERDGSECEVGWMTDFALSFSVTYEFDRTTRRWATPLLAYVNAPTTTFILAEPTDVSFFISDSNCGDNLGSLHLHVYTIESMLNPDVNGDDVVDGLDLGALLGAWGSGHPVLDLDCDGTVDVADLSLLFSMWSE